VEGWKRRGSLRATTFKGWDVLLFASFAIFIVKNTKTVNYHEVDVAITYRYLNDISIPCLEYVLVFVCRFCIYNTENNFIVKERKRFLILSE
jgi:hypothetical protein